MIGPLLAGFAMAALFAGLAPVFTELSLRSPIHQRLRFPMRHCRRCSLAHNVKYPIPGQRLPCVQCGSDLYPQRLPVWLFGAIGAAIGWRVGWSPELLVFAPTVFGLVLLSVIDLRTYLLPSRIIYPLGLLVLLLMLAVVAIADAPVLHVQAALLGAVGVWLFFLLAAVIYPAGMGFGDVRLSALVGLASGWFGYTYSFGALIVAFLLAAIVGIVLMVIGKRGRKDPIPFGPFLALGAFVAIMVGAGA